jgi:carbon storage regulator
MLVLSRKVGDSIVIDGNIVLTVVKVDRNQVRLGIEAPKHIQVLLSEIRDEEERKKMITFDIDLNELSHIG